MVLTLHAWYMTVFVFVLGFAGPELVSQEVTIVCNGVVSMITGLWVIFDWYSYAKLVKRIRDKFIPIYGCVASMAEIDAQI